MMVIRKGSIMRIAVSLIIITLAVVNIMLSNYSIVSNISTGFVVLVVSIYLTYKSRYNILLFIMFFFISYCNYSILYGRYINPSIASINLVIKSSYIDGLGINILLFFMAILLFLVKSPDNTEQGYDSLIDNNRNNVVISWGAVIVIILIGLFFYTPGLEGGKAAYSPIYEYSIIFFIIGFYYCGKRNKLTSIALVSLLLIFVLRDFLGGNRVTGLQLMIIFFSFFFAHKTSYKKVLFYGFIGIILMNLVAIYRSNYSFYSLSIYESFKDLTNQMFAFDTAYFAYLASLTFIGTQSYYSFALRISQFFDFMMSQVLVGTVGENLYEISKKHYTHANGGVLPIYFFYYISWLGTLISALIVSFYSNMISTLDSSTVGIKKIIPVYVVATVPRWYLYSPNQLIRGIILLTIVYYISYFIDILLYKTNAKPKLRGDSV